MHRWFGRAGIGDPNRTDLRPLRLAVGRAFDDRFREYAAMYRVANRPGVAQRFPWSVRADAKHAGLFLLTGLASIGFRARLDLSPSSYW